MNQLNEISRILAPLIFSTEVLGIWWRILIVFLEVIIEFPLIILLETEYTKPIHSIKTLVSISALITIYFNDSE